MAGFEPFLEAWRERWARQRQADAEDERAARALAERLASLLCQRFGARRVILVGSLARGEFRQGSDIDLAVEGIPDEVFFQAGAAVEAAAGGIPVDLVPIESMSQAFADDLFREGIVLHESRRK
jgi:predicted nucleotidyltransferase